MSIIDYNLAGEFQYFFIRLLSINVKINIWNTCTIILLPTY